MKTLFDEISLKPKSAKQLEIVKIKAILACELNKEWHSRLPEINWSNVVRNKFYICFGALYELIYYAVGIWSSPINQRFRNYNEMLELRRLAISNEAPKFTASRMISQMIKQIKKELPEIKRLISYQDIEVHKGIIYKASNWKPMNETKFLDWNKTRRRNRVQSTSNKIRWEYYI